MAPSLRDRIAGSALLAVALVWIVLVYQTIDPAEGTEAGPRAFPLFFGVVLAILSLVLVLQSLRTPSVALPDDVRPGLPGEWVAVAMTIGGLVVYGVVLEPLGFIPSTVIVVVAVMTIVLRITSPVLIASMAIGLSLGSYLVFGKLLGTYLPPGQLFPIYL